MFKNPIYIEYYSHERCDCYKVKNPWTAYKESVFVLCPISEGLEKAKKLAANILTEHLKLAINTEVK